MKASQNPSTEGAAQNPLSVEVSSIQGLCKAPMVKHPPYLGKRPKCVYVCAQSPLSIGAS